MISHDQPTLVNWRDHISVDAHAAERKPIIKGTGLTAEMVLQELASGQSIETTIRRHPELTPTIIRAVFAFATDAVHRKYPGPVPDDFFDGHEWTVLDISQTR